MIDGASQWNWRSELEGFKAYLEECGFHQQLRYGYARHASRFFELCSCKFSDPPDEGEARAEVDVAIEAHEVGSDSEWHAAALRKWYEWHYGQPFLSRKKPGTYRSGDDIIEAIEPFRTYLRRDDYSESTIASTYNSVTCFLGWRFAKSEVALLDISYADVEQYLLLEKSALKPSSANTEIGRIKRFASYLALDGMPSLLADLNALPLTFADWPQDDLPECMDEQTYRKLADYHPSGELQSAAVFHAALPCFANLGMRTNEVAEIDIADIDFANAAIVVPARKSIRARILPLDAETGSALADYLMAQRPRCDGAKLFVMKHRWTGNDEPITTSRLRQLMRYHGRKAGVKNVRLHALRRRTATNMIKSGATLKIVADILGHEDIRTTAKYIRLDVSSLRQVAGRWPGGRHE